MSTLAYPQLMQYPVLKRRKLRTVVNRSADGHVVSLADTPGGVTEWQLQYGGLSDAELAVLETFFAAAEGTLNPFTFLDPEANLLAWSGKLDEAAWVKGPALTLSSTSGGWQVNNPGAGAQSITQTIEGPAGIVYCLSASVEGAAGSTVTLLAGSQRAPQTLAGGWQRIVFSTTPDVATFGLELPAAGAVTIAGFQVEAQPGASTYRESTRGGVYVGARLGTDALDIVTTDVNRHSCTVRVFYADHL
ncbi:MAG TPA: hypothetical protein VKX45_01030 [Bryobacteraceae bacterium]|jgi:hypothetical protein|nr:hypothetical protein [Bryobacteraceae bacterium]